MLQAVGWLGAALLGLCALPQTVLCIRTGRADGLSPTFLSMWTAGEILTLVYVLPSADYPLICNYVVNLSCLAIILRYRWYPRRHLGYRPLCAVGQRPTRDD